MSLTRAGFFRFLVQMIQTHNIKTSEPYSYKSLTLLRSHKEHYIDRFLTQLNHFKNFISLKVHVN